MDIEWGQDGGIGNFLPDLSEAARQSNGFVLEIGVATGTGSTHAFYEGLKEQTNPLLISVDVVDRMVWKPEVPWWHLILGDSRDNKTADAIEKITLRTPDVLFIDTDHTYDQMKLELDNWFPLSGYRTVWLFHDTFMFGERNHMVDAILEFSEYHGMIYEETHPGVNHGLGRMRKP